MPPSLEPHLVDWLRTRICSASDAGELERPYAFTHELNHRRTIEAELVDGSLNWEVRFADAAGESLTTESFPLHRAVADDGGFWGAAGTGKVATNKMFILKPRYHRQGFASAVYGAEVALYSRWNIHEVQLLAVDAGLEVWPKQGFLPKEPEALRYAFRTWLRQRKEPQREPPADLADYPPEFLRSLRYLQLYKVL